MDYGGREGVDEVGCTWREGVVIALALLAFVGLIGVVAVYLLRQFDKIAGRGPQQVADGIEMARKRKDG